MHFKFSTLYDPAVQNKGMAVFPRKINGLYDMISRQDDENILLMLSDNLDSCDLDLQGGWTSVRSCESSFRQLRTILERQEPPSADAKSGGDLPREVQHQF